MRWDTREDTSGGGRDERSGGLARTVVEAYMERMTLYIFVRGASLVTHSNFVTQLELKRADQSWTRSCPGESTS